jgi:hypothetical protein
MINGMLLESREQIFEEYSMERPHKSPIAHAAYSGTCSGV